MDTLSGFICIFNLQIIRIRAEWISYLKVTRDGLPNTKASLFILHVLFVHQLCFERLLSALTFLQDPAWRYTRKPCLVPSCLHTNCAPISPHAARCMKLCEDDWWAVKRSFEKEDRSPLYSTIVICLVLAYTYHKRSSNNCVRSDQGHHAVLNLCINLSIHVCYQVSQVSNMTGIKIYHFLYCLLF